MINRPNSIGPIEYGLIVVLVIIATLTGMTALRNRPVSTADMDEPQCVAWQDKNQPR